MAIAAKRSEATQEYLAWGMMVGRPGIRWAHGSSVAEGMGSAMKSGGNGDPVALTRQRFKSGFRVPLNFLMDGTLPGSDGSLWDCPTATF
jgi:hypothetical protein